MHNEKRRLDGEFYLKSASEGTEEKNTSNLFLQIRIPQPAVTKFVNKLHANAI